MRLFLRLVRKRVDVFSKRAVRDARWRKMFYGGASDGNGGTFGRGSKREKLAGYLRAANEMRQSYQNSYMQREETYDDQSTIPKAFPHLRVAQNGVDEMVLFPSYARPHVRQSQSLPRPGVAGGDDLKRDPGDAEFWKKEWEVYEDANAVVDVDVRGWIYSPLRGQLGRKNRLLLSVARRLSGVPAPGGSRSGSRSNSATRDGRERDEELAERQAREIAARGEQEAEVGAKGGFSEGFDERDSPRSGNLRRPMTDSSLESNDIGSITSTQSFSEAAPMSPEEIVAANTYLVDRLRPFMVNPVVDMTVTIFFYNDETSQSRSTRTNESGHFNFRAALAFIPTHVRVLTSEGLSASEDVTLTESKGVSIISDIDDTIKHSAISAGAREIFRNAFIRDLMGLQIEGVKEWYSSMVNMGVKIHYVSNSPWQMFPLLHSFFHLSKLPPGSLHLKEYSGMLQGVFEPVAERKRGTIDRLLSDFPDRKFILIGDSGEADLEVYTETALMNPGRVLGIFIRDVTTEIKTPFFSSTAPGASSEDSRSLHKSRADTLRGSSELAYRPAPALPPRRDALPTRDSAPDLGDLMDFSEDSEPEPSSKQSATKSRPPPPSKPHALRMQSSGPTVESPSLKATASDSNLLQHTQQAQVGKSEAPSGSSIPRKAAPPPPPPPRRQPSKLSEITNAAQQPPRDPPPDDSGMKQPPPLPARKPWPGQEHATAALQYASRRVWNGGAAETGTGTTTTAETPQERRAELWQRRWARAEQALKPKGVLLRSWRRGDDARSTAEDLIRREMAGKS